MYQPDDLFQERVYGRIGVDKIIYVILGCCALFMLSLYLKKRAILAMSIFSAGTGIAGLLAVMAIGVFTTPLPGHEPVFLAGVNCIWFARRRWFVDARI